MAYQDINYLAACAEDAWVADHALAERLRHRVSLQPFWRALSWPNTLESAADFCRYLDEIQTAAGTQALFLGHHSYSPSPINFQQMLQKIQHHQIVSTKPGGTRR